MEKDFTRFVVDILNECLSLDPQAAMGLLNVRVKCNEKIVNHPHITVQSKPVDCLGMLGIINGILSQAGQALVAECIDGAGNIQSFTYYQVHEEKKEEAVSDEADKHGTAESSVGVSESGGGPDKPMPSLPAV